jgi:hypothetical protein
VELNCNPLYKNGSLLLNPCGLIANSFFTGANIIFIIIFIYIHSIAFLVILSFLS